MILPLRAEFLKNYKFALHVRKGVHERIVILSTGMSAGGNSVRRGNSVSSRILISLSNSIGLPSAPCSRRYAQRRVQSVKSKAAMRSIKTSYRVFSMNRDLSCSVRRMNILSTSLPSKPVNDSSFPPVTGSYGAEDRPRNPGLGGRQSAVEYSEQMWELITQVLSSPRLVRLNRQPSTASQCACPLNVSISPPGRK